MPLPPSFVLDRSRHMADSLRKVPITVYDEEGRPRTKEVLYQASVDPVTGMVRWEMVPGQDLSGRTLTVPRNLRVVSVGGGTGQPIVLKGLKRYLFQDPCPAGGPDKERLTAVVTMTDDGGSSGRLRADLDVLPPGDIRNCLIGLSENEGVMTRLLRYRFEGENGLSGHSLGNLMLAALSRIHGDFYRAVTDLGAVLALHGRILPATNDPARLRAELEDGSVLEGESRINHAAAPIRRVWIHPEEVRPLDPVLEALERAHVIVIGPGSLYTSILPNLLIHGVAEAIQRSAARTVLVANLMTEPEETRGYTAARHLKAIQDHLGFQIVDHVLLNRTPIPAELLARYGREGAEATAYDLDAIHALGVEPVEADLLADATDKIRHDPEKLARAVLQILARP